MIISVTNPTAFVDWSRTIHKMWSCSFWTQPQKVIGYHRETHHFSEEKSTKEFTVPQHTRSFCRRFTPTKSFACTARAVFFFNGAAPWKFHEPTGRDTSFIANAAAQTGAGTSFGSTGDYAYEQWPFTYFCVLTIRKHLLKMRFERSGRGQEPSRGHKFSILENFLSIRDFTSAMRLHFRSDLVGACLPQTLPSNNKVHNCSMDWV